MMRRFWRSLAGQGMSADALALCVVLGLVLGVFPVLGCPTLFCALAALALRLNLPAIQAVNYLVYPLQLALIIPFARVGDMLFKPTAGSIPQVHGLAGILTAVLHAVTGWFCVSVPLGLILYLIITVAQTPGRPRRASSPPD